MMWGTTPLRVHHASRLARPLPRYDSRAMKGGVQPGETLKGGRYEIERLLRAAPSKDVYLARDHVLDCAVVVDVSADAVTGPGSAAAWEARVLGRLGDHPNIGSVIDHWHENECSYMVSRHLPGGSLQDVIDAANAAGEPLPVDRIFDYSEQLGRALEHIHGQRIVHRDLQPRNVLLDGWGTLRLVDFDTAISLDDPHVQPMATGRIIEHSAPEIAAGASADERADLYSLGVIMFALCEGHAHPTRTTEVGVPARSVGRSDLERSDLPQGLKTLVFDLLAPRREDRPASAADVLRRLDAILNAEKDLEALLTSDETTVLEFKSSLRTPVGPSRSGDAKTPTELKKVLEQEVLKTLAAFLNTRGGTLVIGVDDSKEIVGIEVDYPSTKGSADGWRRVFDNLISQHIPEALGSLDLQLAPYRGRTVAIIRCRVRGQPTWLDDELFVRRTASTERLRTKQAWEWLQERSRPAI